MKAPSGLLPTCEMVGYALERWALGHPDDALRIMRRIRQADPLTSSFAVFEALFLFYSGQLDAAVVLYETMIQRRAYRGRLFRPGGSPTRARPV